MSRFPDVSTVEVDEPSTIVTEAGAIQVVTETLETAALTLDDDDVSIIEVGTQGPPGPSGTSEAALARRVDLSGDTVIYKGEAAPGTPEDAPAWRISKTIIGDEVVTTWAKAAAFVCVWNDRATYTYE